MMAPSEDTTASAPPGCLILAAGSHRRFGAAKLLHPLADGRPLICHTLDAIAASGLPMALVHRPDDHALLEQVRHYPLQLIPNPDHQGGLGHSIAAGVRATSHWNGWLICLADMPAILPQTYRAVAQALALHPIVIPRLHTGPEGAVEGATSAPETSPVSTSQPPRSGHPRGFQHRFFSALVQLHGDRGARGLLAQHSAEIGVLYLPDAAILLDIDYPEDLHNLLTSESSYRNSGYPNSNAPLKGPQTHMTEQNHPEHQSAADEAAAPSTPEATCPFAQPAAESASAAVTAYSASATAEADAPETASASNPEAPAATVAEITAAVTTEATAEATAEITAEATPETASAESVSVDTAADTTTAETIPAAEIPVSLEAPATVETSAAEATAETPATAEADVTETGTTEIPQSAVALVAAGVATAAAAEIVSSTTESPAETTPVAAQPPIPQVRFSELPLDPRIQQAVVDMGFEYCTPIQALALPRSLLGKDVIGKAQTGTGKTAAFLITVINHLLTVPEQEERYNGEPRAFILAPTRELAIQIEKDAKALIKHTPLTLMSIVGGMDYQKQQRRLQNEIIDIVVGTPGRLIDFVRNKDLFLSETEIVVIDEADRMLDMGFIPDVKRLVRETPFKEYRQTLMFSATFTQDIMNLSGSWTRNAEHLEVASENAAADTVDQKVYIVTTEEKFTLLYNLIDQQQLERVMIFANRRDETRDLTHKLRDYGIKCAMLSGEVPQEKRIKVLEGFREGKIRVLIATDVAGRGIHIDDITFVVNYTLPEDPEDYVHRIGRTGRAGKSGTSISFACEEDAFQLPAIEKLLGGKLDCSQPEPSLLTQIPPPNVTPEQQRERDSHTHRRRRPPRRQSGNR